MDRDDHLVRLVVAVEDDLSDEIVIRGTLAEMEPYIPAMPAATEAFQRAARLLGLG